jgi:hypothetical protein
MDYGCGYLLADALMYSFLGAREVHAVDYEPLLQHEVMRAYAVETDWAALAITAQPMISLARTKVWANTLNAALATGSARWWEALGITYLAPYDCMKDATRTVRYDAILSISTLEHVPPEFAAVIVARLSDLVLSGGFVDHSIHLEDHRDFVHAPFAFLGADDDYTPKDFDLRGNRLRHRDWRQIFDAQKDFDWTAWTGQRDHSLLPQVLATPFVGADPADLAIGSLNIVGRRMDRTSAT